MLELAVENQGVMNLTSQRSTTVMMKPTMTMKRVSISKRSSLKREKSAELPQELETWLLKKLRFLKTANK